MDYGVRRGLGLVAIGAALALVGLLARGVGGSVQDALQVPGLIGFVLVVAGLAIVGVALLAGDAD